MAENEFITLNLHGYQDQPIPNRFFHHTQPSPSVAILFPGLNYTCDMPLLYFLTNSLLDRKVDVLQARTDYTGAAFQSLSRQEQDDWFAADAQGVTQVVSQSHSYANIILVGKSIGTLALAHLVESELGRTATTLWLTPLLRNPWLVEQACQIEGPSFFIGSRADRSFDEQVMTYIQRKISCEVLILNGVDHRLEYPGDWQKSLKTLGEVMSRVENFLDKGSASGDS